MKWKDQKEKLELLISSGATYEEIGRMYGCTGSNIKKVCFRLGIELKQRRTVNPSETFNKGTAKTAQCLNCGETFIVYKGSCGKFCSHQCHEEYKYKDYIKRWKNGEVDGNNNSYSMSEFVRRYIFEKNNSCCEVCGENLVNSYTGKSILQIHHIDGNCMNNREENLQLLCPNHHAMTENYGSRNKNGNKDRTKYYGKDKPRNKTL